jgi:hypothetical protein
MPPILGSLGPLARAGACALLLPLAAVAQDGVVVTQKSTYSIARIGNGELTQTILIRGADRQKLVTQGRARFLVLSRDASGTEIVRLDEGRIYRVDHRRRQYQSSSFAEQRAELERIQRQAETAAASTRSPEDVRLWIEREPLRRTGQRRTINGFPTEHALLRATVMGESARTGERGPVYYLTAELWLDPNQQQVARITRDFAQAYTSQLGLDVRTTGNPYGRWIAELYQDIGRLEGYPIVSHIAFESASETPLWNARSERQQPSTADAPAGLLGATLGAVSRRPERQPRERPIPHNPAATPGRPLLFSISTEVLTISIAAADAAEFEVPTGYRPR